MDIKGKADDCPWRIEGERHQGIFPLKIIKVTLRLSRVKTWHLSMENQQNQERFEVRADDLVKKINEILKEGNANKIIIQNDKGETIAEFPLTVGVVGIFLSPILAAAGAIAALATKCTIIVEKKQSQNKE